MSTTTAAVPTIVTGELRDRLSQGDLQFWNVLTDDYFKGEMIPGSRRVPLDRVGREAAALSKDAEIVVYCAGPQCPQSRLAAEKLLALGFGSVQAYEGGIEEWRSAGHPIDTERA
jgi:rhodanese-related sulfurtransferase